MSPKSDPSPVSPPTSEARTGRYMICAVKANGTTNGGTEILDTTIDGGDGEPLVAGYFPDRDEARKFVRCVNSHDALLAACEARIHLSHSAPVKDRWQVCIGDRVDSGHESRQLARKRIDQLRAAAIAAARGGAA